jgi:hypothetical protein
MLMGYPQKRMIAFLLCFVVVIAVFSSHTPYLPQQSATTEYPNNTNQNSEKETAEQAIAHYTFWLTIVTAILAGATVGLGAISVYQLKLARTEFIATHRPKITIHAAEMRRDVSRVAGRQGDEYFLGASLLGFNIGESVAKNVEVRGQIFAGDDFAIDVQRPIVKTISEVPSGIKLRADIKSEIPIGDALAGRRTGVNYYCIGWVAYWDENGHRRETGFCFRADFWPPPPASERWLRAGKPEHEYEY